MHRHLHIKVAVACLFGFILAVSVASLALAASPIYVRPGGDDMNCDGTADVDYSIGLTACAVQTIQKGIDLVDVGGTVNMAAGTYNENVVINKNNISLIGALALNPNDVPNPAVHTIINGGAPAATTSPGVTINNGITGVTIRNLRVQNFSSNSGIYGAFGNNNLTIDSVHVYNNNTTSAVNGGGIYMNGPVSNVTINHVDSQLNKARGIVIWNGYKQNITITNNYVAGNGCCGIELQDGTASGVTMTGNTIIGNGDSGIAAIGLTSGAGPNVISNNTVMNNGRFGIEIKMPNGTGAASGDGSIVVENNAVSLPTPGTDLRDFAGIAVFRRAYQVGYGYVDIPTGVVVRNNTVSGYRQTNVGSFSTGFGIVAEGTKMKVEGNTLTNNDVGVQVQSGHLPYTANAAGDGDQSNLADTYFGRGNSPVACVYAPVSGNSYSGNGVNSRNVGTVGPATVTNVNTGIYFCSIQQAIDDPYTLNGHTINVAAGTYIDNVLVNKSVTLAGAGVGSTIVQPAVSNPVCAPGSLCGGAASNVFLIQANNVVIHDLTVDGDNPSLTSGIVRGGADLDARNGIIKDTNGTYNNLEVYNVTAQNIYLRGIYSTGGSFNFHNNTVTNVQGDAASIAMFAWGGPGTMANNTVSYANDGISANHSNGIQFLNNNVTHSGSGIHTDNSGDGGGVADLIQGNTVDCTGTPAAYGIWVFVPYLATTVNNNTITNCDVGLSAWGTGAPVTTQFTNNTVTGNLATGGVGAYVTTSMAGYGYSDVSASFSGNTITGYETGVFLDANQQSWEPGPYVARTINAIFHLNQINGNTNGVDKGATGTYIADFERNWWGAVSGPSGVGPGSGDSIVTGIDYQPWCNADFSNCSYYAPGTISMQTSGTPAEVGEIVTVDSLVTVDGVYGMQLRVNFDSTTLEFQATSSHNDVAAAGWYWDQTVENFVAVSGGRRLSGTMQDPPHTNPATLAGQSVATWRFRCLRPGTFDLTYDATAGLGTYFATKDGFAIPANLTGASVTCLAPTASLAGYIKLQGRLGTNPAPAGWNDASVTLTCVSGNCTGFGPYTLTTDATGHYQLVKATPGSGIVLGTYSAVVSRRAYLGAVKATNVTIVAGTNTINIVSAAPTLLGGDVVAGSGINIGDLAALGGTFGNTVTPDTGNDVNGDGFINIFDLVMAGGNFGQTASVWTP